MGCDARSQEGLDAEYKILVSQFGVLYLVGSGVLHFDQYMRRQDEEFRYLAVVKNVQDSWSGCFGVMLGEKGISWESKRPTNSMYLQGKRIQGPGQSEAKKTDGTSATFKTSRLHVRSLLLGHLDATLLRFSGGIAQQVRRIGGLSRKSNLISEKALFRRSETKAYENGDTGSKLDG
ncbi:hypothetical protein VNI00_017220, partial [Paramarasmius palmivorus]